jgi:excisionase family DNA binding protein
MHPPPFLDSRSDAQQKLTPPGGNSVVQIAPFFDRDGEEPMSEHQLLAEPLLNAEEAARLLKVPRSTLYELVRSRELPHVRVGRTLRFTRQDLSAWIAANSYGQTRM